MGSITCHQRARCENSSHWVGWGCHTPRLAGSLPSPLGGPGPPLPGGGAALEPQGHLPCHMGAARDFWLHWALVGRGHPSVLEGPEISSCPMSQAVSSCTVKAGLAGDWMGPGACSPSTCTPALTSDLRRVCCSEARAACSQPVYTQPGEPQS